MRLTDDLIESALVARMRQAPTQALFDRIVAAAATTPRVRAPQPWLGRRLDRARPPLVALAGVAATATVLLLLLAVRREATPQPGASPSPSPRSIRTPTVAPTLEAQLLGDSKAQRIRLRGGACTPARSNEVQTAEPIPLCSVAEPLDVSYAFGSIWTADFQTGAVSQIDTGSLSEVNLIHVGGNPAWFAFADNALWVTDQSGGITRIDEATGLPFDKVGNEPICGPPAVIGGDIWAWACDSADEFIRVDARANAVADTIPAHGHRWPVAADGKLITIGPEGLATLAPASGIFTRLGAGVAAGGFLLGSDGESAWVKLKGAVERIDLADGRVVASFRYPAAEAVTFAAGHAWLTVPHRGVLKIDLASNSVIQTVPLLTPLIPLEAAGALWVTDFDTSVWRIEP